MRRARQDTLGARRGESLALPWSDIVDGRAIIAWSLTQTFPARGWTGRGERVAPCACCDARWRAVASRLSAPRALSTRRCGRLFPGCCWWSPVVA